MGDGAHVHDARGRGRVQHVEKLAGQDEGREVIDREGLLEAVFRHAAGGHEDAGVVDEHVELVVPRLELGGYAAHLLERSQVGDDELDVARAGRRLDVLHGALPLLPAAGDEDHARALLGKRKRRGLSDALVGARDENGLPLHGSGVFRWHGAPCRCEP